MSSTRSPLRDYTASHGAAAIGARLRRLSERIDREADSIYADMNVDFQQRWFGVVNQLKLRGTMSVGEIAETLRISHAAVSKTCTALTERKLIMSQTDATDSRRRGLSLTNAGKRLAERLAPLWAAVDEVGRELDKEAGAAIEVIARLEAALDRKSLVSRVRHHLEK